MGEDLRTLVKAAGNHIARTVVESHVVYPRTSSINVEKAIYSGEFDPDNLREALEKIELQINLKAIDAVKDSLVILKLIFEFKESLMLRQADYVVIYKAGFDIILLKNQLNPNSGRSIYIEINSCRNELIRYIQTFREERIPWIQIGIAVGVGVAITVGINILQALNKK